MNKENYIKTGFTLIELLAVIVILAVIALIATPLVLNIIERAEKGAFKDSVYGIMEAAEFQAILDDSKYPVTYVFPEDSSRIKFKGTKPSEGYIQIVNEGKIKLALGNGRWCATKEVNDSQLTIKNGRCEKIDLNRPILSGYGDLNQEINMNDTYTMPNVTAVDKEGNKLNVITTIKQGDQVLDSIDTSRVGTYTITYTTEPDKEGYTNTVIVTITIVKKETDSDKVIESGMEDGSLELIGDTYYYRGSSPKNWVKFDGITGDDSLWRIISIENDQIKLKRDISIGNITWDTTGSNDWTRPAVINTYLNNTYLDSLPLKITNKIEDTNFYIGMITWTYNLTSTASEIKEQEKKKTWKGKIGLMNISDYIYASNNELCISAPSQNANCNKNNWLYVANTGKQVWTINASTTGFTMVAEADGQVYGDSSGFMGRENITYPVIYLKSDVKIISGEGSRENPFVIK